MTSQLIFISFPFFFLVTMFISFVYTHLKEYGLWAHIHLSFDQVICLLDSF